MGNAVAKYFKNIYTNARALVIGMTLTLRYFLRPNTVITLQYPREQDKLPDRHRGIHFLETEKCIMCYICAKACPVDCIFIEGTRDGDIEGAYQGNGATITKFVIDYSLCIMCNLCCEPCPKECIHMGQEFHYTSTERNGAYKNLLTDKPFTKEDHEWVKSVRPEIVALAEEKKRKKAEALAAKKAAAEAKKKAEAEKAAKEAAEGGEEKKEEPKPETKAEASKDEQEKPDEPGKGGDS